jgi:hypothetical protein
LAATQRAIRSARLLGHFELYGAASLLLENRYPALHASGGNQIPDFQTYEVAAS